MDVSENFRPTWSNSAELRAANLAPEHLEIGLYEDLGKRSPFKPAPEPDPPVTVIDLNARIAASDGRLISSSACAEGVHGTLERPLEGADRRGR